MVAVEWKEPPAEVVLSARDRLVALLERNPGRWARVKRDLKSKTGTATWKKLGLDAVAAPAESDSSLWDIYARAPEVTDAQRAERAAALKTRSAAAPGPGPAPTKRSKPAPSAAPAAEAAVDPVRSAEEDAAWADRLEDERELVVPVPPSESETSPAAKAVTAGWKGRLGHKPAGAGGRRG